MNLSITQLAPYELMGLYDQLAHPDEEENNEKEETPAFSEAQVRQEIMRRLNLQLSPTEAGTEMQLQKVEHPKGHMDKPISDLLLATYEFIHRTHGASGTSLSFDVTVQIDNGNYRATNSDGSPADIKRIKSCVVFADVETHTIEDAFAKLSEWCKRASDSLQEAPKKTKFHIPI